jgi:hypothetical protein
MAEEAPNLVLEHLRAIRGGVERTEYDIKDLKFRVGQIEQTLVHHSVRFDRVESRPGAHREAFRNARPSNRSRRACEA